MTNVSRTFLAGVTLLLLAVIFLSINVASNLGLRNARIDLTERGLFTLSEGTRNILASVEEPITLRFFYSEGIAGDYATVSTYATRVRDMLDEMSALADGNIRLEFTDPEPFSEDEDVAVAYGLQGLPTTTGDLIYFGLVGTNLVDGIEVIPFFANERAEYLEYDLTRMIHNLNQTERPKLGIVTNLPLDTGAGGLVAAMRGESVPFLIYNELLDRFELEYLEQEFTRVPNEIDVLMIAHPKLLDDRTLYAVDQFVMRGGRVLAFVDPHSEVSLTAGPNGQPVQGYTEASDLEPLLESWGVVFHNDHVVADRQLAQRVATGQSGRRQLSDYVLWLGTNPEVMDASDVITAEIDRVNLGTVGYLTPVEDAATSFQPLISSTEDSMLIELVAARAGPTPDELLRDFVPTDETYVLAARVSGPLSSAFPDGPPPAPDGEAEAGKEDVQDPEAHLGSSATDANIIVVADSEIFDDRFWAQEQNFLGERIAVPIADNAKFVLGAIENLMGSNDLISLRARETAERRFTVVDELQREAEARFLEEEAALQNKITETEARLAELQTTAPGGALGEALVSEQQEAEIQRFRAELVESRKALREVQRSLRRDIEDLGARLRFYNIWLMPLLVVGAAVALAVMRSRARRRRLEAAR